jgi:hypothetical protein
VFAVVIVTNNVKDFLEDYSATFKLVTKSADDFTCIDRNHEKAL